MILKGKKKKHITTTQTAVKLLSWKPAIWAISVPNPLASRAECELALSHRGGGEEMAYLVLMIVREIVLNNHLY